MTPLLQVFDMSTSLAFYRDILGFAVKQSTSDWAWLERDGVELMLNTRYEAHARPPAPDARVVAAHDDTALFFACSDVDAAYAHLRAYGVAAPEPKVAPYGMKQLYVADPDGYNLCFQWPVG
ncbi:MAG TPA: VOC family protein [Gemmatimonadaceae bacterium]|nr:VOC family protein [Gemmatimonadaceae bacterium]